MTTITTQPLAGLQLPRWLRALTTPAAPTAQQQAATSAAELLERADAYEATQPSYAADLRAAAQQHIGSAA